MSKRLRTSPSEKLKLYNEHLHSARAIADLPKCHQDGFTFFGIPKCHQGNREAERQREEEESENK